MLARTRILLRRAARTAVPAAAALTLLAGTAAPLPASAASEDLREQARRLAASIDEEGRRLSVLAEQSHEATIRLDVVERQQTRAQKELDEARTASEAVRVRLSETAIEIYQRGGIVIGAAGADATTVAEGLLRRQYSMSFQARQADALDAMRAVSADLARRQQRLEAERRAASAVRADLDQARADAEAAQARQQALLQQVQGNLVDLVAEEQQRREEAEIQEVVRERPQIPRTSQRLNPAPSSAPPSGPGPGPGPGPAPTSAPKPAPAPQNAPPDAPAPNGGAAAAVAEARRQIGKPYQWGGSGPDSFDCSGLTAWAWKAGGRYLPHSSRAQYSATTRVDPSAAQPGDLFFFGSPIHHVGIYVGNGTMVEASQSGRPVRYASVARRDLAGVGRVT